jgi:hypothetical protein
MEQLHPESLPGGFGEAAAHVTEPRIRAEASDMLQECAHIGCTRLRLTLAVAYPSVRPV